MANAFPFSGYRQYSRFIHGMLHTEDGVAKIRTMSGVSSAGFATATIAVTFVAAGTNTLTIVPSSTAVLNPSTVLTTTVLATDTSAILAARVANQIRTSPVGIFFNVTVSAATITMTAKNRGDIYNLSTITAAGGAYTVVATPVGTTSTVLSPYRPGMFVGYDATSYSNQGQYSVPQFKTLAAVNEVCGILIHSAMARIDENNTLYLPTDEPVDVVTSGIISLELAPGSAAILPGTNANVFLAVGGTTPGRIAATAINASFIQVNQPANPFLSIRPVSGRVTEGNGLATQKFRIEVTQ